MKTLLKKTLTLIVALIFTSNLMAKTIYVNASATGSNNGTSWINAYTSPQSALNAAVDADQIWIAKGIYKPSSANDLTDSPRYYHFKFPWTQIKLYGGFAGTETAINQRLNSGFGEANETVFSGDIGVQGDYSDNCYHVVRMYSVYYPTVVDGVTIKDGNANGSGEYAYGGGLYCQITSATFNNVTFHQNKAIRGGGAYLSGKYNSTASPFFRNCNFTNNAVTDLGGGLYSVSCDPIFENCKLVNNTATLTSGNTTTGRGGGFYFETSKPMLYGVLIANNAAGEYGGGIYCKQGTIGINYSTVVKNSGGGIYVNSFTYNPVTSGYDLDPTPTVVTINNSILWYNVGSQLQYGVVTLRNTCYSNSTGDFVPKTLSSSVNCITTNPKFANLDGGDYRISGHSPCVNTGDNSFTGINYDLGGGLVISSTLTTDLRGNQRIQNTTVDMGAYEWTTGIDPFSLIFVKPDASGKNNGASWANAYTSFQSALDEALSGDVIWVAKGTYFPTSTYDIASPTNRHKHFRLKNDVAIYGGFAGNETATSQRTNYAIGNANETRLSGDLGTVGNNSDNCYHVFYHPTGLGLTNTAILDGFTIYSGNADGSSEHNSGGGIYNNGSSPVLNNISFLSNNATNGGAIYNNASSPSITNANFTSNSASSGGGAMYNNAASAPSITRAIFNLNTAINGGAIKNLTSSLIIVNALFTSNSAPGGGGGAVGNSGLSNCTFTNVTFTKNSAAFGGAIINTGTTSVNNCILWNNSATSIASSGNQINNASGTITLNHSCYSNGNKDVFNEDVFNATNNNVTVYPSFINDANNDFRLAGNSVCVNGGSNSYNSTSHDLRGYTRIQNTTVDMGAYEWTSGTDPANRIICVNAAQTNDVGNGVGWVNAKKTLSAALNIAPRSGDQIWVAKGTYIPTSAYDLTNSSRYYHFRMMEGVSIYGGFNGNESAISQRASFGNGETNETILSGDRGTVGSNTDNCYHVFYHPATLNLTNATVLDGFTIKDGKADGTAPHNQGAAMLNDNASPTLTNVVFLSNSANLNGGAVYNSLSNPIFANVIFKSNSATNGAAIANNASNVSMTNGLCFSNSATGNGGALYNYNNSNATLTNATLTSNSAISGGGIYNDNASVNIQNSILWGNTGTSGKQLYNNSSATTMSYSCYANATGDVFSNGTLTATTQNLTTDPLFINPSAANFALYRNSSCVNSGNNAFNETSADIRKYVRTQQTTIDRGAYEWTSGVDPNSSNPQIYVNVNATGINNGNTWADAYTSLETAMNASLSGNQIWVAKGTYKPSNAYNLANNPKNYHFKMKDGVAVYGGFAGTETNVNQRINYGYGEASETILSADYNNDDVISGLGATLTFAGNTENSNFVFYNSNALTNSAILDGFTIKGANAVQYGGGMYNINSSPILRNLTFYGNSTAGTGGGMCNMSSSPTITNVSFLSNYAAVDGGGMYNQSSSPTISNVTFTSNRTANNGGAMSNVASSTIIDKASFTSNYANLTGGGIYCEASPSTVSNATFVSNMAGDGGAVAAYADEPVALSFTNVKFCSNSAVGTFGGGGAISNIIGSTITFTNSTFAANSAKNGGALYASGSINNFKNCILWGNTASTNGNQIQSQYTTVALNHSCYSNQANDISGTINAVSCINSDPKFVNISSNDIRLFGNSPAVNTGLNSYNVLALDLRGNTRIQNTTIDMGAYEWTSGTDPATDCANPTNGGTIESNETICYNTIPSQIKSSVLPTGYNGTLEYKWQLSVTSSTTGFSDISNSNNENYSPAAITKTTWYKRFARVNCKSDWAGAVESNVVEVTVVPEILYVNFNASGLKNGTSWTNAFSSMQSALNTAVDGVKIWVAKGTYIPSYAYDLAIAAPDTERAYHFRMINGVAIYGGFAGTETSLSQRTNFGYGGANETILSGDRGIVGNTADNCYHVFYHPSGTNLSNSAILDGFTISGGLANGTGTSGYGGGMYNYYSSPTLTNITFTANTAPAGYGGGMENLTSSPVITNCLFFSNSANYGGGIHGNTSSPIITNTTFTMNTASIAGGGMFIYLNSAPALNNCIVWGNSAPEGMQYYSAGSSVASTINYSCYSNGTNDVIIAGGTFISTNNNTTSDPKFVNSTNRDFRLYGNSPAVNSGNNSYNAVTTDIRGKARIQNSLIDMGACEWTSGIDPASISWTGALSTNWNTSDNWSSSKVPTITDAVLIPEVTNYPTVNEAPTSPAVCGALTIQSGATLTIAAGKALTINGVITNNSTNGIVIQSNATSGTGSLIDNGTTNIGGIANVQQYLTAGRNWYVSSPVANATTSALSTATKVQSYNETSSVFVNETSGTNLTVMKGYLSYSTLSDGAITFSGALNSGNKSIALTSNGALKTGFNLVGNPYPSCINWTTTLANAANALTTIWYRTKVGSYAFHTFNANGSVGSPSGVTGQIAPMQAFWVRANTGGGTLSFDNNMRLHASGSNPLKAPTKLNTKQSLLRLEVSNGTYIDETVIYSNTNASNGFDNYDSPKMSNANAVIPELFTKTENEELVINGLNAIAETDNIALGFRTGEKNNFAIKTTEVSNFDSDTHVILKDNLLNIERDITNGSTYNFSSDVTNNTTRFSILFKSSSISTRMDNVPGNNNSASIYKNVSGKIVIHFENELIAQAIVSVYNALGQKVVSIPLATTTTTLSNAFTAGVYIVNVVVDGKTTTRKVIIN